jgi:hypothetical protein
MLKVGWPQVFWALTPSVKVGIRLPLDAWWVISIIHHYKFVMCKVPRGTTLCLFVITMIHTYFHSIVAKALLLVNHVPFVVLDTLLVYPLGP